MFCGLLPEINHNDDDDDDENRDVAPIIPADLSTNLFFTAGLKVRSLGPNFDPTRLPSAVI